MAHITDTLIDEAASLIITTRDFCGNEAEAIREFAAENNVADWRKLFGIAKFRANAEWNGFKKAAGVNPKHIF